MAGMSLEHSSPQLASHPVSFTPDASPARLPPVSMAAYNGTSLTDADIPDSIGAFGRNGGYSDAVAASLTVPMLLPDPHRKHG
jgi:hypothetical protein